MFDIMLYIMKQCARFLLNCSKVSLNISRLSVIRKAAYLIQYFFQFFDNLLVLFLLIPLFDRVFCIRNSFPFLNAKSTECIKQRILNLSHFMASRR